MRIMIRFLIATVFFVASATVESGGWRSKPVVPHNATPSTHRKNSKTKKTSKHEKTKKPAKSKQLSFRKGVYDPELGFVIPETFEISDTPRRGSSSRGMFTVPRTEDAEDRARIAVALEDAKQTEKQLREAEREARKFAREQQKVSKALGRPVRGEPTDAELEAELRRDYGWSTPREADLPGVPARSLSRSSSTDSALERELDAMMAAQARREKRRSRTTPRRTESAELRELEKAFE